MRILLLTLFCLLTTQLFSQINDCAEAVVICDNNDIAFNPNGAGIDDFADPDNENGCIVALESNSAWYYFEIDPLAPFGLQLGFTISPNGGTGEDYDWAVFGPDVNCGDLGEPLRCSSASAACDFCPETGVGMGAMDLSEGPGVGDGFTMLIDVTAGQGFYLLIDNWLGTNNGFVMTWTGTAADWLNCDAEPPCALSAIAGDDIVDCENGGPFTLSGDSGGNDNTESYSWTGTNGGTAYLDNPNSQNPSVTLPPGFSGSITYTLSVTEGLCAAMDEMTLTINPAPSVSVLDAGPLCEQSTAIPLNGSPAGGTWVGAPGGWFDPAVNGPGTHTVTYTYTDALGCSNSASTDITVYSNPTVNITPDPANYCTNDGGINLTAAGAGGASGFSYSWTTPSGNASGPTHFAISPGLYIVVTTDANNCTATDNITVTEFPNPLVTIVDPGTLCESTPVYNLMGVPSGGTWTSPFVTPTGEIFPAILGAGNYNATYTYTDINGCSNSDMISVSIIASPTAMPSNNGPYCAGQAIELMGATDGTGTTITYSWTGPGSYSSNDQNPTDATEGGPYVLQVTIDGCQSDPVATTVNLTPMPDATATNDGPYCPGQVIQLNGSTTSTGTTIEYEWTGPNGYTSSDQNPTDASENGIYNLTISVDGCESSIVDTEVTYNNAPDAVAENTGPYCEGDDIALSSSTTTTGTTIEYEWTGPNSYTSTDQNPSNASDPGIYTVTINVDGCESLPTETEIVVNANPAPVITGDNVFCSGNATTIDAGGPYSTYIWDDGTTNQTLDVSSNGTYFVTVTNGSGCTGVDQYTVTENPSPMPQIMGDASFCEGDSEVCTVPDIYVSYIWNDGTTTNSITVTTGGTYTVTVTDANGCTGENSVTIEELPNPVPTLSGNTSFCEGGSTSISTGDFESYIWSEGSTGTSITVTDPGVYSVTVTNAEGCTGETDVTVSQDENPSPDIQGNTTFCEDETSTLDAGSYNSYLWSDGSTNPTLEVSTLGTYSVTVTNASGCSGEDNVNVTVNANPTPTIAGSTTFCAGSSTTLDAGTNYDIYVWSDGSGGQTLPVSTSGDFSVTVTSASGCTGEASVSVTESSSLNPVISGDLEYCVGNSTLLDAGAGFETYSWSDGSGGQTLDVDNPGSFTVTVTDASGCSGETSVSIVENDLPDLNIIGNDPICTGEDITLDAGGGFDTYTWSNTSLNQTTNITTGGTYSVTVTDQNNCTNEASVDVVENPNPMPVISGDQSFCSGDMVNLEAGTFDQYQWSDGSGNATLDVSMGGSFSVIVTDVNGCTGEDQYTVTENPNPTPSIVGDLDYCEGNMASISLSETYDVYDWSNGASMQSIDVSTPGNIEVVVTDANGCSGTDNVMIVENPNPSPNIAGSSTFCTGTSTILDAGGFNQYQWSDGSANQTLEVSIEDSYSVTVTDTNGCTGEANIDVTESQSLEPVISGDLNICEGETSTLDAGTGFNTYEWSTGEMTQTISANATNDYTVTVSDLQGCTGEITVNFVVNQNPVTNILGDDNFCTNEMVNLDAGAGFNSYVWSDGSMTQTINVTAGDTYSVTVTNAGGCTAEDDLIVTENPLPVPLIVGPNSFCTGNSVTLDAGTGFSSYQWSDGSMTQTVDISSAIDISVLVTDANGCTGTDQLNITENASLTPSIAGVVEFCENSNTQLDAGTGFASYEWSTGEMTQSITVQDGGSYTVIVTDADGCSGSDNVGVTEFTNPNPVIAGSTTFCTGSSATLDAGNFASYLWSDGTMSQTINVNTPGTYTVDVIDMNGCPGQASIDVSESTSLNPVISGSLSFCENENTVIDAGAGFATYLWSDGSMNQTLTIDLAGSYSVTVSDGSGCTGETNVNIAETIPPTATVTAIAETCNTIAGGSVLNLYDLITAGDINGTWVDQDNSGAVGLFTDLNFNNLAAGDYNFIYTTNSAIAPCVEVEYPVIITVIDCACPDVFFLSTDPLCNQNGMLDLTTIENTSEDGIWVISQSPAGANPATLNNNTFDASGSDVGDYILEYQLTGPQPPGCPQVFNLTLTVDPPATAGAVVSTPGFCEGENEMVDLATLINGADPNGTWTETSVAPSTGSAFNPAAGSFNTSNQMEGVYTFTYTVTSTGACPDDFIDVEVVLNALPTAEAGASINIDCLNPTNVLDGNGSSNGATFDIVWSGPGVVMDGNENTINPTIDASGLYTLTITNTITGCSSIDAVQVTDNFDNPQASAGIDQTLNCDDLIVSLQSSGDIDPPFQISWTGPDIDATNMNDPAPQVEAPGIYTITIFNPDNGCSSTDIVEVFQNIAEPVVVTQSALEEIDCNTPTADLVADSPTPNVTYEWFNDQNISIGMTPDISNITAEGIYTVIITDNTNGCTNTETVEVVDNTEFPNANAGLPSLIDCINTNATLDGSASQTGTDIVYTWTGPNVNGPLDQDISSAGAPGTYTLTVLNTANGCSSTDQVVIDENIQLPIVIVNQPEDLDCTIESVTLDGDGSSIGSNFTYTWLDANGMVVSTDLTTDVENAGTYTLLVLNTDNGCDNSATTLVSQNVDIPSSAIVETIDPDCFGDIDGLVSISDVTGGTAPYLYSIDGGSIFNTVPILNNVAPGNYTLTIQDANGCEYEENFTINSPIQLSLDLGGDQSLLLGDSVEVEANFNIPASMVDTILWQSGNIFDCGDPECFEIGLTTFNTIQISATLVDTNGCSVNEIITVQMRKNRRVFIPTAFSPNGDGFNDNFLIYANDAQVQSIRNFRIFNRWGEVVHEVLNTQPNDVTAAWNGEFKGKRLNPGVFIYVAEIEFIDGRVQLYKGDVTLLK